MKAKDVIRPQASHGSIPGSARTTVQRHTIDLTLQHSLCEVNFHRTLALVPGLREGCSRWRFKAGSDPAFEITITTEDLAPYTSTLAIEQHHSAIVVPRLVVRLYHDVRMAEIISWDNHRQWQPHYAYPNAQMYHPDEKQVLNEFFTEWLKFCRHVGYSEPENCDPFRVASK